MTFVVGDYYTWSNDRPTYFLLRFIMPTFSAGSKYADMSAKDGYGITSYETDGIFVRWNASQDDIDDGKFWPNDRWAKVNIRHMTEAEAMKYILAGEGI